MVTELVASGLLHPVASNYIELHRVTSSYSESYSFMKRCTKADRSVKLRQIIEPLNASPQSVPVGLFNFVVRAVISLPASGQHPGTVERRLHVNHHN